MSRKILIRATNWLGDAIMSLPAIRAVARAFPGAQVDVLARPSIAPVYECERFIQRIIQLPPRGGFSDLGTKIALARKLRKEEYELAVLLPNSFESVLIPKMAGIRRIVGYDRDGRGFLLSDPVKVSRSDLVPTHERYYYLEMLRRADIIPELPDVPEIIFDQIQATRAHGRKLFEDLGISLPVIGVAPGAAYGTAKRWLPEYFAESAKELAGSTYSIAIFGSPSEKQDCELVAKLCGGRSLAGETSLREYLDLTAAVSLFLTNDSGAMHAAYASGVPTVTVFGPTRELHTGPVGPKARILRHPVECAPCMLRKCPIEGHPCMSLVPASKVIEIARTLLPN